MDEAATNAAAFQGGQNVSIVLPDDNAELADACQHHNKIIGWRCVPVSRTRLVETLFVDSPRRDRASVAVRAPHLTVSRFSRGVERARSRTSSQNSSRTDRTSRGGGCSVETRRGTAAAAT